MEAQKMIQHPYSILVKGFVLLALALLAMPLHAQIYQKGDTIHLNEDLNIASSSEAKYYGIVSSIDTAGNIANVRVFTHEGDTVVGSEHRVASGQNIGLRQGSQRYFYPNRMVKRLAHYVLVVDEEDSVAKSLLALDKSFYEDGKMLKEEITFTNLDKPYNYPTYIRKCYYPSGALQFEDICNEQVIQTHYYDEKGKEITNPKQKIEPLFKMPEFPGGQEALFRFLGENVKYPIIAQEKGIQGQVVCQFVVNKDGSIAKVEVLSSGGDALLDEEAVRVLKSMPPQWKPGTMFGKPVRVKYIVPVTFMLQTPAPRKRS